MAWLFALRGSLVNEAGTVRNSTNVSPEEPAIADEGVRVPSDVLPWACAHPKLTGRF
ncbi:MAG: hypothetical protein WBO10_17485 [Pyrinomonadaceae bacterium]